MKVRRDPWSGIYDLCRVAGWSRRMQREYLSGLECQLRDTGRQHAALEAWESFKQRRFRALTLPTQGTHSLCLSWLNAQFKASR